MIHSVKLRNYSNNKKISWKNSVKSIISRKSEIRKIDFTEKNKDEYCHPKKWLNSVSWNNWAFWFHEKTLWKFVIKMLSRKINSPKSANISRVKSISQKFCCSLTFLSFFFFWRKSIVHRAKLRQFTKHLSKSWEKLLHIKKGTVIWSSLFMSTFFGKYHQSIC